MNILVSMHYSPPHIGGMETVLRKQLQSLHSYGNQVTVVTCRHNKRLPLHERFKEYTTKRFRALNFIENKFNVTYPLISPFHFFKLLREVGKNDAVHIHDVFYELSHLSGLAAIVRRKPMYITQHVALVDHPKKMIMLLQKTIYHTIGKLLFTRAHGIIVYNANVKDYLISLGVDKNKILQTHNGIDTDFFSPNTGIGKEELKKKYNLSTKPVILFVGRLVHKKGFDIVASCNSSKYTILIAGTGAVPQKLKELRNVIFFGPATESQLLDFYRLSDIFVFPAIGEIFTLVMQEAMACGIPVITTDDPGYKQYALDDRLISFIKRDSKLLKIRIGQILSDKSLQSAMSKYSRRIALESFSWSKNYSKEYSVYANQKSASV